MVPEQPETRKVNMPTMMRETVFAAAGANPNAYNGSIFETARRRQVLSMACVQSVTANFAGINVGPDVVAEEFAPPVLASYPIIPDSFYFTDIAEQGDRIVNFLRATVAVTFRSICVIADA
jgi:hypothetical protein